jgi:hypothetical protein
MTYLEISAQLSRIDWAKVRSFLYNVIVNVVVTIYLVFIAMKAAIETGRTAKRLWVQYKVTAKIQAAFTSLRSDVPIFFAQSTKDVELMYTNISDYVQKITSSMASDYRSIRGKI